LAQFLMFCPPCAEKEFGAPWWDAPKAPSPPPFRKPSDYACPMDERPLLHRIHNPSNYACGCDPDCWCRRTRIGRLVKWWFPARWFGIRHKNSFFGGMTWDEIREWKREQEEKGLYPMVVKPRYEKIVRLGSSRWGFTVRLPDGGVDVREIVGHARLDPTVLAAVRRALG
jgi:hypothetical protein